MSQPSDKQNNNFSSYIGFLAAAVSASVGLSNIWRFPAETAKFGGGVYVLAYLLCVIFVGLPLVLAELAVGRANGKGLYETYKPYKGWVWVGRIAALTCFLIFATYNIITGWVCNYLWTSITGKLFAGASVDPPKEWLISFYEETCQAWEWNLLWVSFVLGLSLWINLTGVSAGIEKLSKIAMPLFVIMLIGLIGYSFTLKGCGEGIAYYLIPQPSKFRVEAFASAFSQAFLSLAVGMGCLLTYGCYVDKKANLRSSAIVISAGDTIVAFLAGFFIFSSLGFLTTNDKATLDGLIGDDRFNADGKLAFIAIPWALFFIRSAIIQYLLLVSFYCLLLFAAITSCVAILEAPSKYLASMFNWTRRKALWICSISSYLLSVLFILADAKADSLWFPFSILPCLMDGKLHKWYRDIIFRLFCPLSVFVFSLFIAMSFKSKGVLEEVALEKPFGKFFVTYVRITLRYICPISIGLSSVFTLYHLISCK